MKEQLIEKAKSLAKPRKTSEFCTVAEVGCALVTEKGNVYSGVCFDVCSLGKCAEHGAIQNMLAYGESRIKMIVAVDGDGKILPPCGVCRELIYSVDYGNIETEVILEGKIVKLRELLPEIWQDLY